MYTFRIIPRRLHFKQPAGTSRGVYLTRQVWYVVLYDPHTGRYGAGECAPLPALSCDDLPEYARILEQCCRDAAREEAIDYEALRPYPSVLFGLETAFAHLRAGGLELFPSPFTRGEQGVPINGLVWMGSFDEMFRRTEEKMRLGFRCIKVKIGAIDFAKELELLAHIRSSLPASQIEIRVDANGAFPPAEALSKLEKLERLELHSIEQPVRAGQWKEMAALCAASPLPVALDEELIGMHTPAHKAELLDTIRPQYIVLKPSLHGGINGCTEWIRLARERNIGYWITSALESNIGLNAIAQWCATLRPDIPQGLGTGMLFADNIPFPLHIESDCLWYRADGAKPDFHSYLGI